MKQVIRVVVQKKANCELHFDTFFNQGQVEIKKGKEEGDQRVRTALIPGRLWGKMEQLHWAAGRTFRSNLSWVKSSAFKVWEACVSFQVQIWMRDRVPHYQPSWLRAVGRELRREEMSHKLRLFTTNECPCIQSSDTKYFASTCEKMCSGETSVIKVEHNLNYHEGATKPQVSLVHFGKLTACSKLWFEEDILGRNPELYSN